MGIRHIALATPHGMYMSYNAHWNALWVAERPETALYWTQIEGLPYDMARNRLVEQCLKMRSDMRQAVPPSEIEGIVWLDDDVMPPADFFIKLLAHPEPIVSALYIARKPPFTPQMYEHGMARVTVADAAPLLGVSESTVRRRVQKGWYSFDNGNKITIPLADKYWPIIHYEPNTTFEVAAAGFGAMWTSFEVIDSIRAQPDFKEWFTFDWPHGEDFSFCERARACGFKIVVDTSIKCAHKANIDVTEESFLSVRDKLVRLNPDGSPFDAPREGAMEVQLEGGTE